MSAVSAWKYFLLATSIFMPFFSSLVKHFFMFQVSELIFKYLSFS